MNDPIARASATNPAASAELARFAFLVADWRCQAKLLSGTRWQTYPATWRGRFILDGYAIADEFKMTAPSGKPIVLGMNFRTYDAAKHAWTMKWLDGLTGTWTDFGLQQFGGVSFSDAAISYAFKEPMGSWAFTRATYTLVSPTHFTWRGEKSDDGKSWTEFMVIDAVRDQP